VFVVLRGQKEPERCKTLGMLAHKPRLPSRSTLSEESLHMSKTLNLLLSRDTSPAVVMAKRWSEVNNHRQTEVKK